MIKTVYYLRYNENGPHVDCSLSAEWPEYLKNETITTLAKIRGVPAANIFTECVSQEVLDLLAAYPMMEMRARLNNLSGPYVVNSEERPCDAALIELARQNRSTTKRKA